MKALFANYEFFRINLSQLREGIKNLGIRETGKVLLLYREPSNISYTSLIRALMVEEDEDMYLKPAGKMVYNELFLFLFYLITDISNDK